MRRFADHFAELVLARPVLCAVVVALFVTLPTTVQPFMLDDHYQLAACEAAMGGGRQRNDYFASWKDSFGLVSLFTWSDGTPERHRAGITSGLAPWWTLEGVRLNFWRPLSSHLALLDFVLFRERPAPYHIHSILWYVVMILAWWLVLRRSLPRPVAVLGLFLFVLDGAHRVPVGLAANRHALVSGTFGLLGLWAYLRWCEEGWRPGIVVSTLLFAAAFLGGENALGIMAYVGAHALFSRGRALQDGGNAALGWRGRLVHMLPAVTVTATWACIYRLKGFGTWGSGGYVDPTSAPGEYLIAVGPRLAVLLSDALGGPAADLWMFVPGSKAALIGIGLTIVGAVAIWLKVAWRSLAARERAALRWMIPGALFALMPVAAAPPMSRLLLIPSLGGSVVLAALIRSGWRARGQRPRPSGLARIPSFAAAALAMVHLAAPPIGWWGSAAILRRMALDCTIIARRVAALAAEGGVNRKHMVVLNSPHGAVGMYLPAELCRLDVPFLRSCHVISSTRRDLLLHRRDARALEIAVQGGEFFTAFFGGVWRSPRFPMRVGDAVDCGAFTIEVDEVSERGPTRVSLRFDEPLDEAPVVMLAWSGDSFHVVPAPSVGTTVAVARSEGPFVAKQSPPHATPDVVPVSSGLRAVGVDMMHHKGTR